MEDRGRCFRKTFDLVAEVVAAVTGAAVADAVVGGATDTAGVLTTGKVQ